MLDRFLNKDMSATEVLRQVRATDMAGVMRPLPQRLRDRYMALDVVERRAAAINAVSCQAGSLALYANPYGNVEARFPIHAKPVDKLYALPGNVILFSVTGHSYGVTRHVLDKDGLGAGESLIIDANTPRLFVGQDELYTLDASQRSTACALALNFFDKPRDINVYCKETLKQCAWVPGDQQAQRYLVSLEAMRVIGDPAISRVARKLLHYPHLEVKLAAFEVLWDYDKTSAVEYMPLLKGLNESGINALLEQYVKGHAV